MLPLRWEGTEASLQLWQRAGACSSCAAHDAQSAAAAPCQPKLLPLLYKCACGGVASPPCWERVRLWVLPSSSW